MNTVLLSEELRDPKLIKLIKEENKSSLVSQLFSVIEEESAEEGLEKEVEKKSVNPNVLIFEAARLAHIAFSGGVRKWGHKEEMPLPWHTSEVGIILLMSGADMPLVYAGFLHDFLEEYPQFRKGLTSGIESEEELKNNKELCSCLTNTFNRIRELVGNEAIVLVWHATEDGRGEGEKTLSWLNRKWSVMERLQNRSFEDKFRKHLAALICASKCSTLAALNKGLYIALKELEHNRDNLDTSALDFLKEKFSSLSKGSLLSNIAHFAWLKGIFEELEVPEPLLQLYEREFERHFMGLATRYLKENEQQGNEAVLSDPDLEKLLSINPNEAATLLESELARVSQRAEEIFQKRR
ncbi:MAG: hypothetical protein D6780_03700 [Candidatus Dadabacteria bacterium]|nr:MAG: hypothetical protein D6780_03700 [Candidatus Dadabacteria bacterium]